MKKILVWKGKHSTEYVDATNESAAYYKLFRIMQENDIYCDLEDPDYMSEDIERLKDLVKLEKLAKDSNQPEPIREAAKNEVSSLIALRSEINNHNRMLELYQLANDKLIGDAAKKLIQFRQGYEYEDVYEEYLIDPLEND